MIECNYNKYFKRIKSDNRILSVPILKDTCINCKHKDECKLHRFNNPKKNNEVLVQNLLQIKDYILESIREFKSIKKDIDDGLYENTYTFKVIQLKDAPLKGVVYRTEEFGHTIEYSVEEYLENFPEEGDKRKLVGVHKVEEPSDVCYGLNIRELETDLEYINNELRRLNENNKIVRGA